MKINYNYQKYLIQDADILLFYTPKFPRIGWWIGKYTNSPYSHVALACWNNDDINCLEFKEFHGSREYPLIKYLENGYKVDVFRACQYMEYPEIDDNNEHMINVKYLGKAFDCITKHKILCTAKELMGRSYSYWTIWRLAKNYIPFIRLKQFPEKNGDICSKNFVCSTFISYSYRINYIDPVPSLCDTCTTPGDIARSAIFFKLFELFIE